MIRCISLDDSPLALELLENYISGISYLYLVKSCNNASEAIEILEKENIDLVFLDIQMPDITGIDLLKSLKVKPKVIFTTAYSNYAIEGFNQNASDYLLKPFSMERFKTAVEKVSLQLQLERKPQPAAEYIFVKSGYETVKINIKNILYIEALKDYIQIFTEEKKVLTLMSMVQILKALPLGEFLRAHRSFIIAIDKITKIATKKIHVGKKEIPIGDIYREEFQKLLKSKKIN